MCFSMFCIFKRHVYFAYSNFPIVSIRERTIVEKMAREEKVWKKTVARDWTVFLGLCSQSTIERDTNLANCLSSPSPFAPSPSSSPTKLSITSNRSTVLNQTLFRKILLDETRI